MHVSWNRPSILLIAAWSIGVVASSIAVAQESPDDLFEEVHRRHLALERFAEDLQVVQIVSDEATDAAPVTTRTRVRLEVDGDDCRIDRPTVAPRLVEPSGEDGGGPTEADLQLLPHLRLRFDDDPLANLRRGRPDGFTPVAMEHDELDGRPIVRLELQSGPSETPEAWVRFEIDAESLLVDRVIGEEALAGGLTRRFEVVVLDREIARSPGKTSSEAAIDRASFGLEEGQAPARSASDSS